MLFGKKKVPSFMWEGSAELDKNAFYKMPWRELPDRTVSNPSFASDSFRQGDFGDRHSGSVLVVDEDGVRDCATFHERRGEETNEPLFY